MKDEIHPPYQEILFVDSSTGAKFLIGSTLQPKETEMFEGKEYPVYHVPVSSSSHPFFTGSTQLVDSEGRVGRFTKKYQKKREEAREEAEEQQKKKQAVPVKKSVKKNKTSK